MKHSVFALPALLRPAFFLATASLTTFSVHDDLLAFPQYEIEFSENYVLESQAYSRLHREVQKGRDAPSPDIEHYRPPEQEKEGEAQRGDDTKLEYESMTLDGQRFLCGISQVVKPTRQTPVNETLSKAEEEKELARATNRGWALLNGMEGNCIYYISGWWSYRFCYNEGVRQFHQLPPSKGVPIYPPVEDPGVDGFTLGQYRHIDQPKVQSQRGEDHNSEQSNALDVSKQALEKASAPSSGELVQRGESRYLVQRLDGGTICDLTGKGRRTEVQFHCNPQSADRISLIKEISTCAYLMVIQTPRLCNDVAFQPPQKDQPNIISCSPVLSPEQVDDYTADLAALKHAEKEAEVWEANPDAARIFQGLKTPQMVGDIEVGGHNIVPADLKLEKSTIVGGGKETFVDTVASSNGKVLSKEEIEKRDLGNFGDIEQLRKKLEQIAKGQEWALKVVDTPRGREYRGIIGGGDDDEKPREEDGGKKAQSEDEAKGSQEE